jgi:peptidyl-prolyl cis-trans isomerase A (cyclophilin A)
MLKNILFLIIISALLFACSEGPKIEASPSKKVVKKPKWKTEKVKKVVVKPMITMDSVSAKLLAYGKVNQETIVDIYTSKGKVRIRLYKDTPLHRASFLLMCKEEYFKHSVFTRVAPFFIAQGGGTYTDEQTAVSRKTGVYTIPSEFKRHHIHKQGAVAAARQYINNPDKRSDPFAFYFVEGTLYNDPTLDRYEQEKDYKFTKKQREFYVSKPGAAHLDGEHTVFGEIINGYPVIPIITQVERDSKDWPIEDVFIDSVKVLR